MSEDRVKLEMHQISDTIKKSLLLLERVQPRNPYAFLSEYYFFASHPKDELIFTTYSLLTRQPWTSPNLISRVGDAFETLLQPSENQQESGVRLKDFFSLTTYFCKSMEPIQLALINVSNSMIDIHEKIPFDIFFDLIVIHLFIQDLLVFLLSNECISDSIEMYRMNLKK